MRLALIGYGAMNRSVETLARHDGHDVSLVITSKDASQTIDSLATRLSVVDVAIDFSIAAAVSHTARACARSGVALVEGTTGWKEDEAGVLSVFEAGNGALVYGANFSIGVNLFYRLVSYASALFKATEGYEPFIEEAHHSRKKDAPSGTALRLRDFVAEHFGAKDVSVASTRAGNIPGTHRVGFDGLADQIVLSHEARSREGFAAGALMAARWIAGRKGVYEFSQVMDDILKKG